MRSFGERVVEAVGRTGPLCAGIDPSAALLAAWELPDDADGLAAFCQRCVEAFAGVLPAVKPQVAFFERHGAAGMAVLERLILDAQSAGLLVVADAKRGDIDSTAEAYADAWCRSTGGFAPDAVTVSCYLGLGALGPMIRAARSSGRGVFVVVRSTNPEGRMVQEALTADGVAVQDALLDEVAALNRDEGLVVGSVGAVVGADRSGRSLADVGGVLLAPGLGAQGAGATNVSATFAGCKPGTVLPSASRSLLAAGPTPRRLRESALAARDELGHALP